MSKQEKDDMKKAGDELKEEGEVLFGLKEVLVRLSVHCATARQHLHKIVVSNGLSFASTVMDELVVAGQKSGRLERPAESFRRR